MTTSGAIFLIVLFIGLFILTMYGFHDFHIEWRWEWWKQILMAPLYALFAILIELALIVMMVLIAYPTKEPDVTSQKDIPIYTIGINDKYNIDGSFVLGCGTVDGESNPVYRFYEINEDSIYVLNEVNAKNFSIVLTDDVVPHIHVNATKCKMVPNRCKWMFVETVHSNIRQEKWEGIIYLPSNSIVQSYQIKL